MDYQEESTIAYSKEARFQIPEEFAAPYKWLDDIKKTHNEAQIFSILLSQKQKLLSYNFAAECLLIVVQNGVPNSMHEKVYNSLKKRVGKSKEGRFVANTLLGVAQIHVWFQMDVGVRPFSDIMDRYSAKPILLLEVLFAIPSQVNHSTKIDAKLKEMSPQVLDFLFSCKNEHKRVVHGMLRVLCMWIKKMFLHSHLVLPKTRIMTIVQQVLRYSSYTKKAQEEAMHCMRHLLNRYMVSKDNPYKLSAKSIEQWFDAIYCLEDAFRRSTNEVRINNFTQLFTALCNAILANVLSRNTHPRHLLKAIDIKINNLEYLNLGDDNAQDQFWIDLCTALKQKDDLVTLCKPALKHLLKLICKHTELDADYRGVFLLESGIFDGFRDKAAALVEKLADAMGHTKCFNELALLLQMPYKWESVESVLFLMQKVVRNIRQGDNNAMSDVVNRIISLNKDPHTALLYTSIQLLGALGNWLQNAPKLLSRTIKYLQKFMATSGLNTAAATALVSILEACTEDVIVLHRNDLVAIANHVVDIRILRTNKEQLIGLLEGISKILARLPNARVESILSMIVYIQLQPLCELIAGQTHDSADLRIDCVSAVLQYIDPKHLAKPEIIADIWLLIPKLLLIYQTDEYTTERTCNLLRQALTFAQMRNCIDDGILKSLIQQFASVYATNPYACLLNLAAQVVELFGENPVYTEALLDMLTYFAESDFKRRLFACCRAANEPFLRSFDEFFKLCSCFITRLPLAFLESIYIKHIVECALFACTLDLPAINSSAMTFLRNMLKCQLEFELCQPAVRAIVEEYGELMVRNAFTVPISRPGVHLLTNSEDILAELKAIISPENFKNYVDAALIHSRKNSRVNSEDTKIFLNYLSTTLLKYI